MGNGYRAPVGEGLDIFRQEFYEIYRRLQELESPTGSQISGNLATIHSNVVLPLEIQRIDNAPAIASTMGPEFATVVTTVPEGFTRALVSITATARLRSNEAAGSSHLMTLTPRIQGAAQITNWGSISGQMYGTTAAACTEVLEGLTAGTTIQVGAMCAFPGTYNLPQVSVAGSILFLR